MSAPVVIEPLYKTYTRRHFFGPNTEKSVLRDVSLTLQENHVLGLVGESGCGKSTLCKVLFAVVYVRFAPFFGTTHKGRITRPFAPRRRLHI